jgi:hypothetical protein
MDSFILQPFVSGPNVRKKLPPGKQCNSGKRDLIAKKRRHVRCLGPGEEHWFWSDGTNSNRRCRACDANVNAVTSPRLEKPIKVEL